MANTNPLIAALGASGSSSKTNPASSRQTAILPRVFPWATILANGEGNGLLIPIRGCGLGDPYQTSVKNMAQPFREQIGYAVFTRDPVTGTLTLEGESQIAYFTTGENEPPPATTPLPLFSQNEAGTNLFNQGAPVPDQNMLFAAAAIGVSVGRPFALDGDTADDVATAKVRRFDPWVDTYGYRLRDAIWSNAGLSVEFRDAAQNFLLGIIHNYPPAGGQYGGDTVRAGGGYGLMGMIPILRGPIYLGSQVTSNQATFFLTSPKEDITVESDPNQPTVSAVAVPIILTAYGDFGNWCGPCAPDTDQITANVLGNLMNNPTLLQQLAAMAGSK